MNKDIMETFSRKMLKLLGETSDLVWDVDKKGVVCGWCTLPDPEDMTLVAGIVADLDGRVIMISSLNRSPGDPTADGPALIINYHFFFQNVNFTVRLILPDDKRTVQSITPVLKSADWHEREMRELFNIEVTGHPNPRRLFLDEGIHMTDHTMIPLSEAMNGASTSTLWERIMTSGGKGAGDGE